MRRGDSHWTLVPEPRPGGDARAPSPSLAAPMAGGGSKCCHFVGPSLPTSMLQPRDRTLLQPLTPSPTLGQDSTEQPPTEPTRVGRSCRTEQGCCLQPSSNTHYIQHLSQNWAAELPASVTATQSRPGACPFPADPRRARVMGAGPARTTLLPKQRQPGGISRAASPAPRSKQQGCPTRAPALSITAAN